MRSGGLIIFVLFAWMAAGLWAFFKTRTKSAAAIQTALYLVSYPAVLALVFNLKPMHPVIAVPLVIAGIPWLLAGVHLQKVIADPSWAKSGEFVGLPLKFWAWGLVLSVGVGALF